VLQNHRYADIVESLIEIFNHSGELRQQMLQAIRRASNECVDIVFNPVRSLDDLYSFLNDYLISMPWQGLKLGSPYSLFRRIDQSIGYIYYLFRDLQFNPTISQWLKDYNQRWADFLDSNDSWSEGYYQLVYADPKFGLQNGLYEDKSNWHSWNSFFSRRLRADMSLKTLYPTDLFEERVICPIDGVLHSWLPIDEHNRLQIPQHIKTTDIFDIQQLLADSPYSQVFAGGQFTHIALDVNNYHRFHCPANCRVLDIRYVDGNCCDGGNIIWDKLQNRYRYEFDENIGFQMLEKRVVMIFESTNTESDQPYYFAVIPIGVAQVGSISIDNTVYIGAEIDKCQELGYFQLGGSDVVILKQQNFINL